MIDPRFESVNRKSAGSQSWRLQWSWNQDVSITRISNAVLLSRRQSYLHAVSIFVSQFLKPLSKEKDEL